MNEFKIKSALERNRKDGGSFILARRLSRVGGGETLLILNYIESLIIDHTVGKKPEQYEKIIESNYGDNYLNGLSTKILYGHYRPKYGKEISHASVKSQVMAEVNKWLVSFDDIEKAFGMGILDIELVSEQIKGKCCHCEDAHETNYVAFAALVSIPEHIVLDDPNEEPIVAFLRQHNLDLITDFYSREGIYVFNLEESNIPEGTSLDVENWRTYVSIPKAKVFAQYI